MQLETDSRAPIQHEVELRSPKCGDVAGEIRKSAMEAYEWLPLFLRQEDRVSSDRVGPYSISDLGLRERGNTGQGLYLCAFDEWFGQKFRRHDLRHPAD